MHQRIADIRTRGAVLALGIVVCGGGCYGSYRTTLPDGGGNLGDAAAVLSITSPLSPTYTNGSVNVEVSLGVATTSDVQLLKNGAVLATWSSPPYAFTWNTTDEVEGNYQIAA